jgi:hypothetical protein
MMQPPLYRSFWGTLGARLLDGYLTNQGMNPPGGGVCSNCLEEEDLEEPTGSSEVMKELRKLRAEQGILKKRVEVLEAKEEITRFMYEWAKLADKIETEKKPEDIHRLAYDLMTPTGTCDFSAIPGWEGIWGPDKQDIITKFTNFARAIGWAYHIYPNASIDVNLDEGTAYYYTSAEFVPLQFLVKDNPQGSNQILFLQQDSRLKRIDGRWKMQEYRLSKLRQVPLGPA